MQTASQKTSICYFFNKRLQNVPTMASVAARSKQSKATAKANSAVEERLAAKHHPATAAKKALLLYQQRAVERMIRNVTHQELTGNAVLAHSNCR